METEIELIELFAGIGGFAKGLEDAGFKIKNHYFSEIDKHSIANYKYNFPHAKHIGSVTDISGRDFKGIDIITFGSPCQDFSIAGNGEGLGGKRSVLILEAIRLVTEIRPPVFIWENVKGAFSSNSGADFWAIIQAFANIGGYRLEWQLLNTKWVLPQNRERIFLIGHLDGRSKPGVFPFTEDNFGFNERSIETTDIRTLTAGGHSGGLHSSMTLISSFGRNEKQKLSIKENADVANCLTSRMHKDFKENMIHIGAIRGRNPKSRKSGLSTEQMLEINENGCLNTLTSVQKDNVVVSYSMGSAKPGRSCINSGRVPEIGDEEKSIRRLTEIECERLQGFPQQKIFICLERIKNHAPNAEAKCPKLLKFALNVERTELNLNALFVNQNLNIKPVQISKPVLENVHINFGENAVEIHNQGKLIFSAKNVESKNWFHPLMKIEDFVLLLVRTNLIQEKTMLIGKEEFRAKEQSLIHQKNSRKLVKKYGKETMQLANDAEKDLIILSLLLKFTTSSHLNTKKVDVILKTWFSFVIHVITGFIPEEILTVNLSNLSLSIDSGWTKYGVYEKQVWINKKEGAYEIVEGVKEVPKTQRYKQLGNAVTSKIITQIGIRLKKLMK